MPNKIERQVIRDKLLERILEEVLEMKELLNEWKKSQKVKKDVGTKKK